MSEIGVGRAQDHPVDRMLVQHPDDLRRCGRVHVKLMELLDVTTDMALEITLQPARIFGRADQQIPVSHHVTAELSVAPEVKDQLFRGQCSKCETAEDHDHGSPDVILVPQDEHQRHHRHS